MNTCCLTSNNHIFYRKDYGHRGRGGFEMGIRCKRCQRTRLPLTTANVLAITTYHQQALLTTLEELYQEGLKFDESLSINNT